MTIDPLFLPGGTCLACLQTLADHIQIVCRLMMINASQSESLLSLIKQHIETQHFETATLTIEPLDLGIDALFCSTVKIGSAGCKGEPRFRGNIRIRKECHQPVEKCCIGKLVHMRRTGWNHAVLDADMRLSVSVESNQRTVPAPDRAIMQAQMGESLRIVIREHRQQHRVALQVGLKYLEDTFFDISEAERDPVGSVRGADRDSLLKQRDARLFPQLSAKQKGGVGADSDNGGRGDLGGIVVTPG